MAEPCQIRPATPADLHRLVELEAECFSDPWSKRAVAEVLSLSHTLGLVATVGEPVVAYVLARAIAGSAEILTLGVEPGSRRKGFAARLLETVLQELRLRGVEEVWLEVRESNLAARALYGRLGFGVAGMRRAYYRRPTEDALVLKLPISGGA